MLHSLFIGLVSMSSPDTLDELYQQAGDVYVGHSGRETAVVSRGTSLNLFALDQRPTSERDAISTYGGFFCTPNMIFGGVCEFKTRTFTSSLESLETMLNAHVLSVTREVVQWYILQKTEDDYLNLFLLYARLSVLSNPAHDRESAERILVDILRARVTPDEDTPMDSRIDTSLVFQIRFPISTASQRDEVAKLIRSIAFMRNPVPDTSPAEQGSFRDTYQKLMAGIPHGFISHQGSYDVTIQFDSRNNSPIIPVNSETPIFVGGMVGTFEFGTQGHLYNLETPDMLVPFIMENLPRLHGDRSIVLYPGPRHAMLDIYMATSTADHPSLFDAFFARSIGPMAMLRIPTTTAAQQEIAGTVIDALWKGLPQQSYEPSRWTFAVPVEIQDDHEPYAEMRKKASLFLAAFALLAIGVVLRILLIRYHSSRFPHGYNRTRDQNIRSFFRPLHELTDARTAAWRAVHMRTQAEQDASEAEERRKRNLLAQQERDRRIAERRARDSQRTPTPPDMPAKPEVTPDEVAELRTRLLAEFNALEEEHPNRSFILRELQHAEEKPTLPAKKKILSYALEKTFSAD